MVYFSLFSPFLVPVTAMVIIVRSLFRERKTKSTDLLIVWSSQILQIKFTTKAKLNHLVIIESELHVKKVKKKKG